MGKEPEAGSIAVREEGRTQAEDEIGPLAGVWVEGIEPLSHTYVTATPAPSRLWCISRALPVTSSARASAPPAVERPCASS